MLRVIAGIPGVFYILKKANNDGDTGFMDTDILSIGMVVTIGLMAGAATGLVIGYPGRLAKAASGAT